MEVCSRNAGGQQPGSRALVKAVVYLADGRPVAAHFLVGRRRVVCELYPGIYFFAEN